MARINEKIILFDGECKLCSAWVPFVINRDLRKNFKFSSVQSPKGQELLNSIGMPTDSFETMVLLTDEKAYYKSDAFLLVIKELKKPWPLLNIFKFFPAGFRNWTYDRIALNRYKLFGRNNYCMIPTNDLVERFID